MRSYGIFDVDLPGQRLWSEGRLLPTSRIEGPYASPHEHVYPEDTPPDWKGEMYLDGKLGVFAFFPLENGTVAQLIIDEEEPYMRLLVDDFSGIVVAYADAQPSTNVLVPDDCDGYYEPGCFHDVTPIGRDRRRRQVTGIVIDTTDVFRLLAEWSRLEVPGLREAHERAVRLRDEQGR